jgi:hypothetical protein
MSGARILHIAQDEKFITGARYLFEKAFPGDNQFVIVKPPADPPLRYIDDQFEADFIIHSSSTVPELINRCKKAKVVIFHGLNKLKGAIFRGSREKYKFVGIIYGAEVYNCNISGDNFLGEKSSRLNEKLQGKNLVSRLKGFYQWIRYFDTNGLYEDIRMEEIFYKINTFGFASERSHQKFINNGILNPESRMIPFSYYPLDYIIGNDNLKVKGANILLGNSASATNNHLEAIDILKKININGRKVISPLSYGQEDYANAVELYGNQQLPLKFETVRKFMPLQHYNELICSCGCVVMNHYRSQAMGTLISSIYLGAKVFLNETDAYHYFKSLGCYIYLIDEDLVRQGNTSLSSLSQEQVNHNRRVLRKELSADALVNKLRYSFMELFGL